MNIELVDALSHRQLATTHIEQSGPNTLQLQDSLALAATRLVRKLVGDSVSAIVSTPGTRLPMAWDARQRAASAVLDAEHSTTTGDTTAALRRVSDADSMLTLAAAEDERWTEPLVQRARLAYWSARLLHQSDPQFSLRSSTQIRNGLALAERALRIAPNDIDALEIRGTLKYLWWESDLSPSPDSAARVLRGAEQDLAQATAGDTQRASAWSTLSHLRLVTGYAAGAADAAQNALRLDPYAPGVEIILDRLFKLALYRGDRVAARKWCEAGLIRFRENYLFLECQLWMYTLPAPAKLNVAEMWMAYDAYVSGNPPGARGFVTLKGRLIAAMALARDGQLDTANALARASQGDSLIDPARELKWLAAGVHARAGDKDAALALLRGIFARPQLAALHEKDDAWWLKDLRSDPRYQALLRHGR